MRPDRLIVVIGVVAILLYGVLVVARAVNPTCCCDPTVTFENCHCLCRWVPWI